MAKHHYVYHSYEEWEGGYIGCRTCDCPPEEDIKYFGSFSDKTFFPTEKTILFVCETRQEAMEIEIKLHDFFDVAVNPQFANMAKATSTGFDRTGLQSGEKNPMYGRTGEKNPRFGVPDTEEQKQAKSKRMAGVPRTEGEKKKLSVANSGEKNPNYGNTGALHPGSKAIIAIEPDGTQRHYGSGREAARELEINHGNLSGYLNTGHVPTKGKWKGWQFLYKNSENF